MAEHGVAERELHWVDGYPLLVWRAVTPWLAVSSAAGGGGIGLRDWVLNATVRSGYDRDDPAEHIAELAGQLDLPGKGVGLLTAVDVRRAVTIVEPGVVATVTTGVGQPIWAAEPRAAQLTQCESVAERIGTISTVCMISARLADSALVNAVGTVTEAKTQALAAAGVPGTGTCTDAVALLCRANGEPQPYGGPRSEVGAPLARAVHEAVRVGLAAGTADGTSGRFVTR